jgi:hypothetical protein
MLTDPLGSKHVAINTTNKIVLTVFTPLIIRKHNGLYNFKLTIASQANNIYKYKKTKSKILNCSGNYKAFYVF